MGGITRQYGWGGRTDDGQDHPVRRHDSVAKCWIFMCMSVLAGVYIWIYGMARNDCVIVHREFRCRNDWMIITDSRSWENGKSVGGKRNRYREYDFGMVPPPSRKDETHTKFRGIWM